MSILNSKGRSGIPSYLNGSDWGNLNRYLRSWATGKPFYNDSTEDPRYQSPYGFDESSVSWRLSHGLPANIEYSEQQYANDAKQQMMDIMGGILPGFFDQVGWTNKQKKEERIRDKWGYLFGNNSYNGGTTGSTNGNPNYWANYGTDNPFNPHPGMNFLWRDSSGMLHDYGDNPPGSPPVSDNFQGLPDSNYQTLLQNGMNFLQSQNINPKPNWPGKNPTNNYRRPNPVTPLQPLGGANEWGAGNNFNNNPVNPPAGAGPVGSPPGTNAPPYGFGSRRYSTQPIAPMRKAYKTSFY